MLSVSDKFSNFGTNFTFCHVFMARIVWISIFVRLTGNPGVVGKLFCKFLRVFSVVLQFRIEKIIFFGRFFRKNPFLKFWEFGIYKKLKFGPKNKIIRRQGVKKVKKQVFLVKNVKFNVPKCISLSRNRQKLLFQTIVANNNDKIREF